MLSTSTWTPGCGRPHPDLELILAWAQGKVTVVEKQRVTPQGRPYGHPVRAQFPCWNTENWKFDVAKNSQFVLDLEDNLTVKRKTK